MNKKNIFPSVSVIVVNYNGLKWLRPCFNALLKTEYPKSRLELIMVDNGSSDNSVSFMKQNYPKVHLLRNSENNYASGNNLGVRHSNGEFIVFLNNDTEVTPPWLVPLVNQLTKIKKAGAAMPKLIFPDGKIQSAGHVRFPHFYWADRGIYEPDIGQYDQIEEVETIPGTAALFRKRCLEEVGFLDEDFNMFLEDVDICLRIRKQGWKCFYVPTSKVIHAFHGTIVHSQAVELLSERNRLLLAAKHFPEKLPQLIMGKELLFATNGCLKPDRFLETLPLIVNKIMVEHPSSLSQSVIKDLLNQLPRAFDFEQHLVVQKLFHESKERLAILEMEKGNLIHEEEETRKDWESERTRMEEELTNSRKSELERANQIRTLEQEIVSLQEQMQKEREEWQAEQIRLAGERTRMEEELANSRKSELERVDQVKTLEQEIVSLQEQMQKEREEWQAEQIRLVSERTRMEEELANSRKSELERVDQVKTLEQEIVKLQGQMQKEKGEWQAEQIRLADERTRMEEELTNSRKSELERVDQVKTLEQGIVSLQEQILQERKKWELKQLNLNQSFEKRISEINEQKQKEFEESEVISQQQKLENANRIARLEDYRVKLEKALYLATVENEKQQAICYSLQKDLEVMRKRNKEIEFQLAKAKDEIYQEREKAAELTQQVQCQKQQLEVEKNRARVSENRLQELEVTTKQQDQFIHSFHESETFQYLIKPLWKGLDLFKKLTNQCRQLKVRFTRTFRYLRENNEIKTSISLFSTSSRFVKEGEEAYYTIVLANGTLHDLLQKLVIDIYFKDNPVHPDGHYAYFTKEILIPSRMGCELHVKYDWKTMAHFVFDGVILKPDNVWRSECQMKGKYLIHAILSDLDGHPQEHLTLVQELTT